MSILIIAPDATLRSRLAARVSLFGDDRTLVDAAAFEGAWADREVTVMVVEDGPPLQAAGGVTQLRRRRPNRQIILMGPDDPDRLRAAMGEGAAGYVRLPEAMEELPRAIDVVLRGGVYLPPLLALAPVSNVLITSAGPVPAGFFREGASDDLTPRQREVLAMLRAGWSNEEVAESLGVTVGTVKIHVTAIFKTLGVRNRTQAMVAAERMDLPRVPSR